MSTVSPFLLTELLPEISISIYAYIFVPILKAEPSTASPSTAVSPRNDMLSGYLIQGNSRLWSYHSTRDPGCYELHLGVGKIGTKVRPHCGCREVGGSLFYDAIVFTVPPAIQPLLGNEGVGIGKLDSHDR